MAAEIIGAGEGAEPGEREVIVLLLWHLGDVLNATALLPELEARHDQRLTFATTPACAPILAHHPSVERIRVVEREIPALLTIPLWFEIGHLHQELFPQAAAVYNLHVPVRLTSMPHHIMELWARAVRVERSAAEITPRYYPDPAVAFAGRERPYLALGAGGAAANKRWPAARWQRLIAALREHHPQLDLIQLGSPGDRALENVEDLRGTSVGESHHLVAGATGCLTNDSFLSHLSAAAGTPTVVIFGPTSPAQFRPLGPGPVRSLGGHGYRTPCTRNFCRLGAGRMPCLAFPSARAVIAAVDDLVERDPFMGGAI